MSWDSAVADLRKFLSDGPTDRYRYRQETFPNPNGRNKNFRTFEMRRVSDFTKLNGFVGVYKNGELLPPSEVTFDDLTSGEFTLSNAPNDGDLIQATFYVQWFADEELTTFLQSACETLGFGEDFTGIETTLRPAAKRYAASEAYTKLAIRWSEHLSDMYRVQDRKDPETKQTIDSYFQMAVKFREDAEKLTDRNYTRQGQNLAPNSSSIAGRVPTGQTRL